MTTFHGGPADGATLPLRGAPHLLRVTRNPRARKHPFDALDQPSDKAEPFEELHVYSLRAEPFQYHVQGSKELRGWWAKADYDHLETQPPDEDIRDNANWRAWCAMQPIGPVRAGRLEAYLQGVGVLDPLSFSHSWCRWKHASLAELTEGEGRTLIAEAAKAAKILKVNPTHYEVPTRAPDKVCAACGAEMWFVKSANGKDLPITARGISHYLDCSDPSRFSRGARA